MAPNEQAIRKWLTEHRSDLDQATVDELINSNIFAAMAIGYEAARQATIADYQEVLDDHKRLVRELDVLLNGEAGAAKQASLSDIVRQVKSTSTTINTK
jgi:hypothetical protein